MKTAVAHFWRLGSDNLVGFLCLVIREWQETGKVISHLGTLAASELKSRLERDEQGVVDVREPSEWKEGYIEGANAYSSGT